MRATPIDVVSSNWIDDTTTDAVQLAAMESQRLLLYRALLYRSDMKLARDTRSRLDARLSQRLCRQASSDVTRRADLLSRISRICRICRSVDLWILASALALASQITKPIELADHRVGAREFERRHFGHALDTLCLMSRGFGRAFCQAVSMLPHHRSGSIAAATSVEHSSI